MGLLNVYSLLISNWLNNAAFLRKDKLAATDIRTDYNLVLTKQSVKKLVMVPGIRPEQQDLAFQDYIRDQMQMQCSDVKLIFNTTVTPCKIDVNGDKFARGMSKAANMYEEYQSVFNMQDGVAKMTGKTYRLPGGGSIRLTKERLESLSQIYKSYLEVYNVASSGGSLCQVDLFIEIVAPTIKLANQAVESLYGILGPLQIGAVELKNCTRAYLMEHGPACPPAKTLNKKFLPQMLFTDSNLTAFSSYKSRGLVSDQGLLLGLDVRSRLPLLVDLFRAPTAEVFLILGKTGSGKTYSAFQFAISALSYGCHVSALDVKGREWRKLVDAGVTDDYTVLTFDDKNPSFVNILRLDDLQADEENCEELFNSAVKGAVALLSLVVNLQPGEGNPNDLELVLREAVLKLYSNNSVSADNPRSFERSKDLRYADILPILESLQTTISYTKEQKDMLGKARARLHSYFGSGGIFSEAFTKEITVADILDHHLVIYELNKNQNAMSDSLDAIRMFMIQFLDTKKKALLRKQDKFLFAFYEELQRAESFGATLLPYICGEVTGSRSNNAVVCLLLNSLKVLQGSSAQDIRSNITSFIVGSVEPNDIEFIEEGFNRPWLAGQLRLFANNPKKYRHAFAADIDTGADTFRSVYRVELPKDLSEKFKTRTTIE